MTLKGLVCWVIGHRWLIDWPPEGLPVVRCRRCRSTMLGKYGA